MYDTIIKGGTVIDPGHSIHECRDIAISAGKIVDLAGDIPRDQAERVIEARGKIVAPGLIDLHAHVCDAIIPLATSPDRAGVLRGVTTVCDGGSTGHTNFAGFRKYVISQARTDVFCYLNVCPTGLALMPEIRDWRDIEVEATLKTARENDDLIKGIKVRAVSSIAEKMGLEAMKLAKKVARDAGLPLMVHIGDGLSTIASEVMDAFTLGLLGLLEEGDVVSHIYTGAPGSAIKTGKAIPAPVREAAGRGVVMDTAHGRPNLSFLVASYGMSEGILPTTISTDLASTNIDGPIYSLLLTMSKFMALGLTLDQVLAMTTINPARVLKEEQRRGGLKVGMPADVSLLELIESDFTFADGLIGNKVKGRHLLVPYLTLKAGVEIDPKPGARDEVA